MLNFIKNSIENNKKMLCMLIVKINFFMSDDYARGKVNYYRVKSVTYRHGYIGSQQYHVVYNIFLEKKLKHILDKHRLKLYHEDYMGLTGYTLYKNNKKISEFLNSSGYTKMEEVYWYVTNNFK